MIMVRFSKPVTISTIWACSANSLDAILAASSAPTVAGPSGDAESRLGRNDRQAGIWENERRNSSASSRGEGTLFGKCLAGGGEQSEAAATGG